MERMGGEEVSRLIMERHGEQGGGLNRWLRAAEELSLINIINIGG